MNNCLNINIGFLVTASLIVPCAADAFAQCNEQVVQPSISQTADGFGENLALDGNMLAVGSWTLRLSDTFSG